jgi:hypothetical protein
MGKLCLVRALAARMPAYITSRSLHQGVMAELVFEPRRPTEDTAPSALRKTSLLKGYVGAVARAPENRERMTHHSFRARQKRTYASYESPTHPPINRPYRSHTIITCGKRSRMCVVRFSLLFRIVAFAQGPIRRHPVLDACCRARNPAAQCTKTDKCSLRGGQNVTQSD